MWNTKDLQNSISKQIVILCCQLVIFENYLSHSQPWNTFEKPTCLFFMMNNWACSAYKALWECTFNRTAVMLKKAKLHKVLTLDWASAERPIKAIWICQLENNSSFDSTPSRLNDILRQRNRVHQKKDGTLNTALSIFPVWMPHFSHIRCALHLHTLCYISVIVTHLC